MSEIKSIQCPMCGKALLIGYDLPNGKDTITGDCYCINEKKNACLTMLREAGHDIRPTLFVKRRGGK